MCSSTPLIISLPLHSTLYTLHPTLYTFYSSLITHRLYLKLRFPSLVPYIYTSDKRPRMNQRRTKERPKNSKLEKVLFIKIGISFAFLIPTLILPRELRATTERTPTQLPAYKKCCFLRLLPNKVVLIPKKVDSFPKTVDYIPKIVAYPPNKKSPQNCIFLAQSKIFHYLCTRNKKLPQNVI